MNNKDYLESSLDILFRDKETIGYWDNSKSRIHGKLLHTKDWVWNSSSDNSDRYGVFCLSMILISKMLYGLELSKYSNKIRKYLSYISDNIMEFNDSDIYYGAFNSLVLGHILDLNQSTEEIEYCVKKIRKNLTDINDNQNSLILIGLSLYLKFINSSDKKTKLHLNNIVDKLLLCQNSKGMFNTGDIRYTYHQRTMYTLWGLIFSYEVTKNDKIQASVEKSINYIWDNMRDEKDDAFHWHPPIYRYKFIIPIFSVRSYIYLYECHQSFFSNTISFYKKVFKTSVFNEYSKRSMNWIFGDNRIKKNLIEINGLKIPIRVMKTNGEIHVENQNFKGSYELGSFILQLSALTQ